MSFNAYSITNIMQGVDSADYTNRMIFYKSNFNMPVPNLFSGTTFANPYHTYNASTSYDLTGFSPGFEICIGGGTFVWDNSTGASTYTVSTTIYIGWMNPSRSSYLVGPSSYYFSTTLPVGYYYNYTVMANIGCAPWEVSANGTYYFRTYATGSPTISTVDTAVSMYNVPTITTLSGKAGYIWVEGNNLAFVNANEWKHSIVGIDQGYAGGTVGHFWCDSSQGLSWIGSDGHKYIMSWSIKQFASTFSNGSPGAVYAGTSNGGKIWVDAQFGLTHIAFINPSDGYKYLCGAGNYPY